MSEIVIPVDDTELWSAVFGSAFETWDWWAGVEYLDGSDWDKPGKVRLKIDSPVGGPKFVQRTLKVSDLVRGLTIAHVKGYRDACSGRQAWLEMEYDACEGDCILQCAIFGEVIYG